MFWTVHQCMRNTLARSGDLVYCRGFNVVSKLPKAAAVRGVDACQAPAGHRPELSLPETLSRRLDTGLSSGPCASGRLYCTKTDGKDAKDGNDVAGAEEVTEKRLTLYQKFKKMYKEYWYVLVPVHIVTSSFWFGGFYYLAASGIDIPALMASFGAPSSWVDTLKNTSTGNLVLAYTLYKVSTPIRYTVTLGGTTVSINYLKKWGWIKPVPNKEQIKRMYQEGKGVFKDFQDKMQVTKDELLKTKSEIRRHCKSASDEFHRSMSESRRELREATYDATYDFRQLGSWVRENLKRKGLGGKK